MPSNQANPLSYLGDQLDDLEAKGLHFRLRVLDGEQKPLARFDGREVINLGSNNYLGLTTHKALRRAAIDAIRSHGVGAGAVRTIAGTIPEPRVGNNPVRARAPRPQPHQPTGSIKRSAAALRRYLYRSFWR